MCIPNHGEVVISSGKGTAKARCPRTTGAERFASLRSWRPPGRRSSTGGPMATADSDSQARSTQVAGSSDGKVPLYLKLKPLQQSERSVGQQHHPNTPPIKWNQAKHTQSVFVNICVSACSKPQRPFTSKKRRFSAIFRPDLFRVSPSLSRNAMVLTSSLEAISRHKMRLASRTITPYTTHVVRV